MTISADTIIGFLLIIAGFIIVILRINDRKKGFKGSIQANVSIYGVGFALIISGLIILIRN
jgi:hypothetical protein